LGKCLFIDLEDFVHRLCLIKNTTSARSSPCEKRVHARKVVKETRKEKPRLGETKKGKGELTFAYSFREGHCYNALDIEFAEVVDVPRVGCGFAFAVSQEE
jgi:hypothetical protein